uniref:TetR family transcriptional regulator C-terminal domain-containing protein n=1 Tax=uncultured Altibacter sp. TaxID=2506933 RepID=UPI0030D86F67
FEVLTANRSYVLFTLRAQKDMMKHVSQLKGLRTRIKGFAAGLIAERNDEKQLKLLKNPVPVFSEGAWIQTLFLLKYWMDDNSPKFERTDIVIEKSVRAIFDVFDTTPLESVIDFGKYLWKERMT